MDRQPQVHNYVEIVHEIKIRKGRISGKNKGKTV